MDTAEQFNRKANDYDKTFYSEYANMSKDGLEKVTRLNYSLNLISKIIENKETVNILDYGCGTGIVIKNIIKEIPTLKKIRYTGYDISEKMIDKARENCFEKKDNISIKFTNNDSDIELNKCGQFNIVLSLGVVGYQANHKKFIQTLLDATAINGNCIFTIGNGDSSIRILFDKIKEYRHGKNKTIFKSTNLSIINSIASENAADITDIQPIRSYLFNSEICDKKIYKTNTYISNQLIENYIINIKK